MQTTVSNSIKEVPFLPGEEKVLYACHDSGVITHMWFGGDFPYFMHTKIRFYFSGEALPSIEAELGMMHGMGFDTDDIFATGMVGKTGHPSGIYNNFYIPYQNGIKITVMKDERNTTEDLFWSIVRGSTGIVSQIAGLALPQNARLKLQKLESYEARPLEEMVIYKASSTNGALFMVTVAAKSSNFNFQESCVRGYFEGQMQLLSSGLEDYFLGTYYFNRGKYHSDLAGVTQLLPETEFSGYRFHHKDPVFFRNDFHLTMRCGEKIEEKQFWNPQPTTYTIYTWAYEWE